ncbi:cellulose biosynthesis protein BcsN [Aliihoeflea sp. PC F10.4]
MRTSFNFWHLLCLAGTGLALAACASPTDLQRSSMSERTGPAGAMAVPPPGGPTIVDVVERRYANAIQQDVVLGANASVPGQNTLRVQLFGSVGNEAGQTDLSNLPPTEGVIRREMRTAFPGVAMQVSPLYAQNSYGPFGYAMGRSGRDLCLYAWQRIRGAERAAPFGQRGTIQTRLRLCQAGASEQQLLAVMYGYTITGGFAADGWNPFGAAASPDPRLGAVGTQIFPVGASWNETVAPAEPEPLILRPARRAVSTSDGMRASQTMPAVQPAASSPAVPAPTVAGDAPLVPPPPGASTANPVAAPAVPAPPPTQP